MLDNVHITRNQSFLIAAGFIGAFLVVGFYLLQSKDSARPSATGVKTADIEVNDTEEPQNVVTLSTFKRSEIKDGVKVWDITAAKGRHLPDEKRTYLESPLLTLYNEDGSTTTVKALSATLHHTTEGLEKAELFDDVMVEVEQKIQLATKNATFFVKEQKVNAPGAVDIKSDGLTIKGKVLEGDLNTNTFKILEDVDTVIEPRK